MVYPACSRGHTVVLSTLSITCIYHIQLFHFSSLPLSIPSLIIAMVEIHLQCPTEQQHAGNEGTIHDQSSSG